MFWSFQKWNVNVKFCYITGSARPDRRTYEFPDGTPKFAGQVLPDRTESGLTFLNILPTKEQNFNQIETSL